MTLRHVLVIVVLASLLTSLTGCQHTRRIRVTSEPTGALVHLNDVEVGRTPLEVDFTYFGTYDVRLSKAGYEPLRTTAVARPRLHDQPVLDLGALFVPGGVDTIIDWHFEMARENVTAEELLQRALAGRDLLGDPPAEPELEPAVAPITGPSTPEAVPAAQPRAEPAPDPGSGVKTTYN
ncbi:MAG: PEGA domain-containing protein [Planctomycetota bacterium]